MLSRRGFNRILKLVSKKSMFNRVEEEISNIEKDLNKLFVDVILRGNFSARKGININMKTNLNYQLIVIRKYIRFLFKTIVLLRYYCSP